MMVRISLKYLLSVLIILGCLLCFLYNRNCTILSSEGSGHLPGSGSGSTSSGLAAVSTPETSFRDIDCFLNREVAKNIGLQPNQKRIECKTDGEEVYIPFSLVERRYEAKGAMVGDNEFEISQSYSKVFPSREYQASGPFMHFGNFKVELRSRVLCVSAVTGVPVSTQWDPAGYYYPTQIAQFALAHYSNHLGHREVAKTVIDNGADVLLDLNGAKAKRVNDKESDSLVIEFKGSEEFIIDVNSRHLVVCLELRNLGSSVVTIEVKLLGEDEMSETIRLQYRGDTKEHLAVEGQEIVFGLGSAGTAQWVKLTRDVTVDLDRARTLQKITVGKKPRLKVTKIRLSGHGQVRDLWVSDQEHRRQFLQGADWFLGSQDSAGGWPSQVVFNRNSKKYPGAKEVDPGWYGAMCQGQAISVLVRAHLATGLLTYLEAANRAMAPFSLPTSEGGVKAEVLGHPWYEEYPTQPPSHILNGFMYALLGLHDLATVQGEGGEAATLYRQGRDSLLALLPLYDSGSGTFYDLRHLTMQTAPKGARWDYHATHINQLLTLGSIEEGAGARKLRETAERWRGYMVGQRAPHN